MEDRELQNGKQPKGHDEQQLRKLKLGTNENQQNTLNKVFCHFLFSKPQYYSPLYDAHGVGRVNTTSFTFDSAVSSQGPLPKEDPVGV